MSQFEVLGQSLGTDRLFLIGGPCVLESREMAMKIARFMKTACERLQIPYVFKSSYDKANRTSWDSFRGPGLKEGLDILASIRKELGVPVLTDVHSVQEARGGGRSRGYSPDSRLSGAPNRSPGGCRKHGQTGQSEEGSIHGPGGHDSRRRPKSVRRTTTGSW